jgi:hypothetical protein
MKTTRDDFGGNREKSPDQSGWVRKILKLLERKGLVVLRQGRHGGVGLWPNLQRCERRR